MCSLNLTYMVLYNILLVHTRRQQTEKSVDFVANCGYVFCSTVDTISFLKLYW